MSEHGFAPLDGVISVRPLEAEGAAPTWDSAEVLFHRPYAGRYRRLRLLAPSIARSARAGQFVMVTVDAEDEDPTVLLPRPMAIHRRDIGAGMIDLIYNVVGRGTLAMSYIPPGTSRLVTGPLGRGFAVPGSVRRAFLIGRGVGICSVMGVAEDCAAADIEVTALLSARSEPVLGREDLAELGVSTTVVTDGDGSSDVEVLEHRLLTAFGDSPPDYIAVCGSNRLILLASRLARTWGAKVEASIEAHMACGLGYCHGCAAPLTADPSSEGPLVCVDGPVFAVSPA